MATPLDLGWRILWTIGCKVYGAISFCECQRMEDGQRYTIMKGKNLCYRLCELKWRERCSFLTTTIAANCDLCFEINWVTRTPQWVLVTMVEDQICLFFLDFVPPFKLQSSLHTMLTLLQLRPMQMLYAEYLFRGCLAINGSFELVVCFCLPESFVWANAYMFSFSPTADDLIVQT